MTTLEKIQELSEAVKPHIGTMRTSLSILGKGHYTINVNGQHVICYSDKELDKSLESMLMILKAIEKKDELKES